MKYVIVLIALYASVSLAFAGDPEAGKGKATACAACHGPAGVSANPDWPNLAGQKAGYLAIQLKAFRGGDRVNILMSPMAAGLSDDDIDDLAAYYAGL